MQIDLKTISTYPTDSGVYIMKDTKETVIYVGKAKNLRARLRQYFGKSKDSRDIIPYLTAKVASVETIVTANDKDALLLENTLIKRYQPRYNALLKDDKTYLSLMINHKDTWPMIRLVRYKGKPKKDGLYFGPYTSAVSARETLKVMQRIFPLRQCSDRELTSRTRPCILHDIKRCIAPCVNKCTKLEYKTHVDLAISFLKGDDLKLNKALKDEMQKASDDLEFERAAEILHTLKQLEHVQTYSTSLTESKTESLDSFYLIRKADFALIAKLEFRSSRLVGSDHYIFVKNMQSDFELLESFLMQHYSNDTDFPKKILIQKTLESQDILEQLFSEKTERKISIETPQRGENKKVLELTEKNAKALLVQECKKAADQESLLLELQETLKLSSFPMTIECFDTSSHGGDHIVAAMVQYKGGKPYKTAYRKYTIKTVTQNDDYASLREALFRRYSKLESENLPDLVLIDGGKGQLSILKSVFQELDIANVDLISIAKEKSLHTKSLTKEVLHLSHHKEPVLLDAHSRLLFFLQNIRDEAHRFVISFYRKTHKKNLTSSKLDKIEGIGPVKKQRLLAHFKSLKAIENASEDELLAVQGITKKDIECLKSAFSSEGSK